MPAPPTSLPPSPTPRTTQSAQPGVRSCGAGRARVCLGGFCNSGQGTLPFRWPLAFRNGPNPKSGKTLGGRCGCFPQKFLEWVMCPPRAG